MEGDIRCCEIHGWQEVRGGLTEIARAAEGQSEMKRRWPALMKKSQREQPGCRLGFDLKF